MKTTAIIVAAGSGSRLGGDIPKQFRSIAGKPVLAHTVARFEAAGAIDEIVIATSHDWMAFVAGEIVDGGGFAKVTRVIEGGASRQESVYECLMAVRDAADIVAVHDAVRPLVSPAKIDEAVAACRSCGAAILAVPPKDTIKEANQAVVARTLDRTTLWAVQTPQVFDCTMLVRAYEKALEDGVRATDDAALVELLGAPVKIVSGDYMNFKITVPEDLRLAELLLAEE